MGRLVLLLIFVLCTHGTLQKKGERRVGKPKRNISEVPAPGPRTFTGCLINKAGDPNGTQAPGSPGSHPALQLLSNISLEYLGGPLSTRVIPVVYMLVVAVGVPANLAILFTLAFKIRKVSAAVLYCSLAVSDLLLLLSLVLKARYHFRGNDWDLGEAACRAVTACFYGNLYGSAQTLACISLKRYLAAVHPFRYRGLPKGTCAAWVTLALWAAFAAAAAPVLVTRQSYLLPNSTSRRVTCHDVLPLDSGSHGFLLYCNLTLSFLGLLLPLVVTGACFARIVCALNKSHHDWSTYIRASSLVFTIFLVCFAPAGLLHFLHYVRLFADRTDTFYVYFNAAVCLCCLHACLDPFLFVLLSKSARSGQYTRAFKGMAQSISV